MPINKSFLYLEIGDKKISEVTDIIMEDLFK
jgi:hypothetical protein